LQLHGSPLIAQAVLRALFSLGVVPAEPGEFTRRAFLNGKIDLVQAEAVADLIAATSERALRLAEEQLGGRLSEALETIGEPLRNALAELEALIDFSDEDIAPASLGEIRQMITDAREHAIRLIDSYNFGNVVKEGFRVLIAGLPNVGKSSLLNLLLARERAIVTPISGTTRDLIEEETTIGGYRFVVCDSAGITETNDPVERIGVALARERLGWADLVLYVVGADTPPETWRPLLESIRPSAPRVWLLVNKVDLVSPTPPPSTTEAGCELVIHLSAKTRVGFDALTTALITAVESRRGQGSESGVAITNERQRRCLDEACTALTRAVDGLAAHMPIEIVSADVRTAIAALAEIVGQTYTEDILGRIFARFCIGK
jgi:tRNA modification GTPase